MLDKGDLLSQIRHAFKRATGEFAVGFREVVAFNDTFNMGNLLLKGSEETVITDQFALVAGGIGKAADVTVHAGLYPRTVILIDVQSVRFGLSRIRIKPVEVVSSKGLIVIYPLPCVHN